MTEKPSVTGRDGLIVAKALAYAIAFIDSLPEEKQERSDRADMVALLHAAVSDPVQRERLARSVEANTGVLPDLTDWKAGDPSEWTPGKREG
jgi:hypothetical protein